MWEVKLKCALQRFPLLSCRQVRQVLFYSEERWRGENTVFTAEEPSHGLVCSLLCSHIRLMVNFIKMNESHPPPFIPPPPALHLSLSRFVPPPALGCHLGYPDRISLEVTLRRRKFTNVLLPAASACPSICPPACAGFLNVQRSQRAAERGQRPPCFLNNTHLNSLI